MNAPRRLRADLRIVEQGRGGGLLIDRYGVRAPVVLSPEQLAIARAAGGSLEQVRRAIGAQFGVRRSTAELKDFLDELEGASLLEGAAARADRRVAWNRALVAETLIVAQPGPAAELRSEAEYLWERARGEVAPGGRLEGVLAPHGDLSTTGACAARAFALLERPEWPDVFVVLGTSHYGTPPSLLARDLMTPLGPVPCDRELAAALATRAPRLAIDPPDFLIEHSWRQSLPLLQIASERLDRPLRILPLLVGDLSPSAARRLAREIAQALLDQRKRGCLIASGDLTHYGPEYAWRPPWLRGNVAERCRAIRAFEQPLLEAIARKDQARFAGGVAHTSFCARAQVAALIEFVLCQGELLAHQTVLNGRAIDEPPERPWRARDWLFDAAAIAFRWRRSPGARGLCTRTLIGRRPGRIDLLHLCDLAPWSLPEAHRPVLREVARGFGRAAEVGERLGGRWADDELSGFVAQLDGEGLLHPSEPPSAGPPSHALARAERVIADARRAVPFYARLRSDRLADAPFLLPETIRAEWPWLAAARRGAGRLHTRRSSASTGAAPVTTVVEQRVRRDRLDAELLIRADALAGRTLHLNRPSNLELGPGPGGGPARRRTRDQLAVAPGDNPTAIAPDTWARVVQLAAEFDPEVLEGDPAYLAELARQCLARGVELPRLARVAVGHGFAWQIHLAPIRRAFRAELVHRYHSSELGEMALSCDHGALHLIEARTCYEILDRGVQVPAGRRGALVATTLDTRVRPLVRYAIGDLVELAASECRCGRPYRVVRYVGRLRHLVEGPRGRAIGYADLDRAIGAPRGVRFFRLTLGGRSAKLDLIADRELTDVAALRAAVERTLGRTVRVAHREQLSVPPGAKLALLETPDLTAKWRLRFLGRA